MRNPYVALLRAADDNITKDNYKPEGALFLFALLVIATLVVGVIVGDFLLDLHPLAFFAVFVYPLARLCWRGYHYVTDESTTEEIKRP